MALKLIRRPCALSTILVVLLILQTLVTHFAAHPIGDKTMVQDEEIMTSAEMQKQYVRPEGGVEVEIGGADDNGDNGEGSGWDRGGWNDGRRWDEGGNWDTSGGWNNRPRWAALAAN